MGGGGPPMGSPMGGPMGTPRVRFRCSRVACHFAIWPDLLDAPKWCYVLALTFLSGL